MSKRIKNDDEEISLQLDKVSVLQQAKEFNKTGVRGTFIRLVLINLLRLLNTNCEFSEVESTDTFFSLTRLIQSKDESIRQLVLLTLKEFILKAKDVIIITSTLIKDMQPSSAIYRPNAIRTLIKILDAPMLQSIERVLKNCIVEKKDTAIKAAALTSTYLLNNDPNCNEIIKRWTNEINDALTNTKKESSISIIPSFFQSKSNEKDHTSIYSTLFQYHALGLMYNIKKNDKMAILKIIRGLIDNTNDNMDSNTIEFNNVNAYCLAIKIAANYIDTTNHNPSNFYEKLSGLLRHRSDAVNYEAAKTIINLKNLTKEQVYPAVKTMQQFFGSIKTVYRLAALKQINQTALKFPSSVANWNIGLEELIDDTNKTIAITAITTLLIIGSESKINSLIKKTEDVIMHSEDENKIVVVEAVKKLVLKSQNKSKEWIEFIASMLRYDSGFIFKQKVVKILVDLDKKLNDNKISKIILLNLCEFIEDCEFSNLTIEILYYIGFVGPLTDTPSTYIRFIYNRIVLETQHVRAAAVSALSKFSIVENEEVKKSIEIILTSCLTDHCDEVRDRALIGLQTIKDKNSRDLLFIQNEIYSLDELESALTNYLENKESVLDEAFSFESINKVAFDHELNRTSIENNNMVENDTLNEKAESDLKNNEPSDEEDIYSIDEIIKRCPLISKFGPPIKQYSKPQNITEDDTDYPIHIVKHVFKNNIVIQFVCKNMVNDCRMEEIAVNLDIDEEETVDIITKDHSSSLNLKQTVKIKKLDYNEQDSILVIFEYTELTSTIMTPTVSFVIKEFDTSTGKFEDEGFNEEINTKDISVNIGDYIILKNLDFDEIWHNLENENSVTETFVLEDTKNIKQGVIYLNDLFCLNNDTSISKNLHAIKFCGILNNVKFAVNVRMAISQNIKGLNIEINARAENERIAEALVNAIE